MVLEGYITNIIKKYTEKYLVNVSTENLPIWKGDLVFKDVELRLDVLQEELDLPVTLIRGYVKSIRIKLPLTTLLRDSIEITADTVEVVAALRDSTNSPAKPRRRSSAATTSSMLAAENDSTSSSSSAAAAAAMATATASSASGFGSSSSSSSYSGNSRTNQQEKSWIGSLLSRVALNIRANAVNVNIKFIGNGYVSTVSLKSLSVYPTDSMWQRNFVDYDGPSKILRRVFDVVDLTWCIDNSADHQHFTYELPVMNRLRCSIRTLVHCSPSNRVVAGTPSTHVDIHCDGMAIGISDNQLNCILSMILDIKSIIGSVSVRDEEVVAADVKRVRDRTRTMSRKIAGAELVEAVVADGMMHGEEDMAAASVDDPNEATATSASSSSAAAAAVRRNSAKSKLQEDDKKVEEGWLSYAWNLIIDDDELFDEDDEDDNDGLEDDEDNRHRHHEHNSDEECACEADNDRSGAGNMEDDMDVLRSNNFDDDELIRRRRFNSSSTSTRQKSVQQHGVRNRSKPPAPFSQNSSSNNNNNSNNHNNANSNQHQRNEILVFINVLMGPICMDIKQNNKILSQMVISQLGLELSSSSSMTRDTGEAMEQVSLWIRSLCIYDHHTSEYHQAVLACGKHTATSGPSEQLGHSRRQCLFPLGSSPGMKVTWGDIDEAAIHVRFCWEAGTARENLFNNSNSNNKSSQNSSNEGELVTLVVAVAPIRAAIIVPWIARNLQFFDPLIKFIPRLSSRSSRSASLSSLSSSQQPPPLLSIESSEETSPTSTKPHVLPWISLDINVGEILIVYPVDPNTGAAEEMVALAAVVGPLKFENSSGPNDLSASTPSLHPMSSIMSWRGHDDAGDKWVYYEGCVRDIQIGLSRYSPAAWSKGGTELSQALWWTQHATASSPSLSPSLLPKLALHGRSLSPRWMAAAATTAPTPLLSPSTLELVAASIQLPSLHLALTENDVVALLSAISPKQFAFSQSCTTTSDSSSSSSSNNNKKVLNAWFSDAHMIYSRTKSQHLTTVVVSQGGIVGDGLTIGYVANTDQQPQSQPPQNEKEEEKDDDDDDDDDNRVTGELPPLLQLQVCSTVSRSHYIDLIESLVNQKLNVQAHVAGKAFHISAILETLGPLCYAIQKSYKTRQEQQKQIAKESSRCAPSVPPTSTITNTTSIPAASASASSSTKSSPFLHAKDTYPTNNNNNNNNSNSDMDDFVDLELGKSSLSPSSTDAVNTISLAGWKNMMKENAALKLLVRGYEAALSSTSNIMEASALKATTSASASSSSRLRRKNSLTNKIMQSLFFFNTNRSSYRPIILCFVLYTLTLHLIVGLLLHRLSVTGKTVF